WRNLSVASFVKQSRHGSSGPFGHERGRKRRDGSRVGSLKREAAEPADNIPPKESLAEMGGQGWTMLLISRGSSMTGSEQNWRPLLFRQQAVQEPEGQARKDGKAIKNGQRPPRIFLSVLSLEIEKKRSARRILPCDHGSLE
ncbi:hypothetical protein PspLS_00460, partial [Pyricularia sp. CBS 133598]